MIPTRMVNSTKQSRENYSKGYDNIYSGKKLTSVQRKAEQLYGRADIDHEKEILGEIKDLVGKRGRGRGYFQNLTEIEEKVTPIYESLNDSERSYVQGILNISRRQVSKNMKRIKRSEEVIYNLQGLKGKIASAYSVDLDNQTIPSSRGLEGTVEEAASSVSTATNIPYTAPIKVNVRPIKQNGWLKYVAAAGIVVATSFLGKYLTKAQAANAPEVEPTRQVFVDESARVSNDSNDVQAAVVAQVQQDIQKETAKYAPEPNNVQVKEVAKESNLEVAVKTSFIPDKATVEAHKEALSNPFIEYITPKAEAEAKAYIKLSEDQTPKKSQLEVAANTASKWVEGCNDDAELVIPENSRIEVVRSVMPDSHMNMVGRDGMPFKSDPKFGEYGQYLKGKADVQWAYGEKGSAILTRTGEVISYPLDGLRVLTYRPAAAVVGGAIGTIKEARLLERAVGLFGFHKPYESAVKRNTPNAWETGAKGGIETANFVWRNMFGPNHNEEYAKFIEWVSSEDFKFNYQGDPFVKEDGLAGFLMRRASEFGLAYGIHSISDGGGSGSKSGGFDRVGGEVTGGNGRVGGPVQ